MFLEPNLFDDLKIYTGRIEERNVMKSYQYRSTHYCVNDITVDLSHKDDNISDILKKNPAQIRSTCSIKHIY